MDAPSHGRGGIGLQSIFLDIQLCDDLLQRFGHAFTIPVKDGFGGSKGQDLPGVAYALHVEFWIDHGLCNGGITAPDHQGVRTCHQGVFSLCFCRGSHGGPHVRLELVGHLFSGLIDHRGGPDFSTGFHIDAVTGDGNQCTGRSGIIIDKYPDRNAGIQKLGADGIGSADLPPVSIQVKDHQVGPQGICFLKGLLGDPPGGCGYHIHDGKGIYKEAAVCL